MLDQIRGYSAHQSVFLAAWLSIFQQKNRGFLSQLKHRQIQLLCQ